MDSMNIQTILKKLDDYEGEDNYISEAELAYIAGWLDENSNKDEKTTLKLIDGLQWGGLDNDETTLPLYPTIISSFKSATSANVASRLLDLMSDMVYYTDVMESSDIEWIVNENRSFNSDFRLYKGAKCDLLAKVLNVKKYKDIQPQIHDWILKILDSGDDEYNDLLAFCLTNNETKLPQHIKQRYREYLQNNGDSEASEEVKKVLTQC